MPRPQRRRRICRVPTSGIFSPESVKDDRPVILTLDEFEAVRLIDTEKQTHKQCARQMEISRSTVTEIYESAREKIGISLVYGRPLIIKGGVYRLCDGRSSWCYKKSCEKRTRFEYNNIKGEDNMKIAVTYDNGEIFQHFGHSEQFKIYNVENGKVVSSEVADTNGSGHGALGGFLKARGVDALICGGIGAGAQNALAEAGIKLYGGVSGSADKAVEALLKNELNYNPDIECDHHGHEHVGNCGEHGCGERSCH